MPLEMINATSILSVLGVLLLGCFLPIEVPYIFNSTAIVYPTKKWELTKNNDQTLVSSLHNYESGATEDFTHYQFDRGDIVNISFTETDQLGKYIEKNTSIAKIESNILSQRLIQLENEISIENANLARGKSGQKYAVIRQAKEEISLATQEYEQRKNNLERAERLFPEGLVSRADLEEAKNSFDKSKTMIQLAEKAMTVKKTGMKREEIDYIYTRIQSLEREQEFLVTKIENYNISAPISGKVSYESHMDYDKTVVEDISSYILYIPVKLKDIEYMDLGDKVTLDVIGMDTTVTAQLLDIGEKVEVIDRNFVVIAKAQLEGKTKGISTGMPVKVKVSCGDISPIQYITQSTRTSI